MDNTSKKTTLYLGGALVLGAVGFFVYSFFKKPNEPIVEKEAIVENEKTTTEKGKDWTKVFADLGLTVFNPKKDISTPPNFSASLWNSVK